MNNYKKIILNNGIPLYLYNNPSLKQVCVNYIVKYGSSGEYFNFSLNGEEHKVSSGHAHFLEHVLLEHSKYGNTLNNLIKKQYYMNAITSFNYTSFYIQGIKDIKESIKELIEAVDIPVFGDKEVNQSRIAIIEEAKGLCDNKLDKIPKLVKKNLYKSVDLYDDTLTSIGDSIINENITTKDLQLCYDAFYNDDNKVLVMLGNLDEKELVDYLNEIYDNIPKHKSNLILPNYDYEPIRKDIDFFDSNLESCYHGFGFKIKKPNSLNKRDMELVIDFMISNALGEETIQYNGNSKIIDNIINIDLGNQGDYYDLSLCVSTSKPDVLLEIFVKKMNKKIKEHNYRLIMKSSIADEIRLMDDKYIRPQLFPTRMNATTDYSDLDYLRSIDYEKFISMSEDVKIDDKTIVKTKKR